MEKLNKIEYTTKEKVVPEKKVIQTITRVQAEKEKAEPKVKVHQTRSREKSSPETKPIDAPPASHFNLRARKKVSYKV